MSSMRGLVQFIADLRNARARELEEKRINKELANIRSKFRGEKLDGYQKKKYVCKLLYIYIQGYNVDFGHLEAVNLISATKYSEKQIGYLAVTLFLHEQHDLLHLVVNSIRKDLMDNNELNNCLALHAVANVGGREMGEALSADVHRLLISPTSKAFVKKKAALTLLRLYRKHPGIIQQEWAERIISLMDDPDMGVTLSVTSLVMALVQDNPDAYKGSYVKAAQRLRKIVIENEVSPDYLYYKVPCPWIQVKFLKLLQFYPPSEDTYVRGLIRESLAAILQAANEMPKNVQQNNAQNAVLFEAINLLIHLDTESNLMIQISSKLGRFIQSRETNIRYLGMDAMTHFVARSDTVDPIKRHQNVIIGSLRDRDISVRRKALDLLYSMCDTSNAQPIVNELMRYLTSADYSLREEMVLKIAILTEKYATEAQWYIDVSLRLLALAGDHVSDEVWQRVVQIVTNNEELQAYAAQNILEYIKTENCHDTLVKIGGYLLGEFGLQPHRAAYGSANENAFLSRRTRALILSTFIKYVNLFPEIKPQLLQMFNFYSYSPDSELQQRAFEYLSLANMPTDDLLRTVCDEMPPFSERASILLQRLHKKSVGTSERRTWVVGGKDANTDKQEVILAQNTGLKRTFTTIVNGGNPVAAAHTNGASNGATNAPNLASTTHLSPDWRPGYLLLSQPSTLSGVLFEDAQLQVGLRAEYRSHLGVLKVYFTNKSSFSVGSFTVTIDNPAQNKGILKIDTKAMADSNVEAQGQTVMTIVLTSIKPFTESPTMRVSFLAGALQAYTLKLPVQAFRFMEGSELGAEEFFKRWRQIGNANGMEAQDTFAADARGFGTIEERVLRDHGFKVLQNVDPNKANLVGCGVYQGEGGKMGCLVRLEPNEAEKKYRVTIRATQDTAPAILLAKIRERLVQAASSNGTAVGS
ncbi:AP-2 complex subunit alpha [Cyphellophora attinorum]|uniref:AP-2 complex subunit alpha n=1 Tax=Cyphellophora attinorum TaxID=1664694 RepID=A0A0N1P0B7_9EURO|nr:AP-2 complex subunit alpha [Phialophora attinorum]KPI39730.1 AP-2 complex subunit alpha [Phialophora attinorum]